MILLLSIAAAMRVVHHGIPWASAHGLLVGIMIGVAVCAARRRWR